jgi:uncharacterized protein with von Willebrand factor type A (vWA) domain
MSPMMPERAPLLHHVQRLASELRRAGVAVSTGDVIDAGRALGYVDLLDRATVRAVLRATMAKDPVATDRFDRAFGRVFGPALVPGREPERPLAGSEVAVDQGPAGDTSAAILAALGAGDAEQLRLLAARAVELYGGDLEAGSERYLLQRVLRAVDLSRMMVAAMQQLRRERELDEFALLLARNELRRLLEEFRRALAAEIAARRPLEGFGPVGRDESLAVEDVELGRLAPAQLAELRRIVRPLARQLAARVGRRRKPRPTGRLDVRRTVRRSIQSGGVPIDVVNRRRHPHRPDVALLCDVSGSVADFAQFTFDLVNAVHAELASVRSFAFVDGVAEVTDLFAEARYDLQVARVVERRGVVGLDGHSDYGQVFGQFERSYLAGAVTHRTTVIVTGDARGNYRDDNVAAFARLAQRARRLFWLNPEPRDEWGEDDSLIEVYRPHCTGVYEVRTVRQLADVIAQLV